MYYAHVHVGADDHESSEIASTVLSALPESCSSLYPRTYIEVGDNLDKTISPRSCEVTTNSSQFTIVICMQQLFSGGSHLMGL